MGGYFFKANGDPGNCIAKWDGNAWSDVGGGTMPSQVSDMIVYHGDLYVGGQIDMAGGIPVSSIAKWDGSQWYSLGSEFEGSPATFTILNDELYAGGGYWNIDGCPVNFIARYTTDTVYLTPNANFGFTVNDNFSAYNELTVLLKDSSTNAYSYQWDFGDGDTSSEKNPIHTYISSGTYSVVLTIDNYCTDSAFLDSFKRDIAVHCIVPTADFLAEIIPPNGLKVTFLNTSTFSYHDSYHWDFGDGTTSNDIDPVHYYDSPGTYTVMLIANHLCSDTLFTDTVQQDITLDTTSGIANTLLIREQVKVFPNPASSSVYVEFDVPPNIDIRMNLYNLFGQKVYNEQFISGRKIEQKHIVLNWLRKGYYLLQIRVRDNVIQYKVIYH